MKGSKFWRLGIVAVLVAVIAAIFIFFPVNEYLKSFSPLGQGSRCWGPIILASAYIPACIFYVPGWILTMGSGFVFGVIAGSLTVSIGSVIGASTAFLLGRTLMRDWIESKVISLPRFRAIDRAVEQNGFKIVLLTRLSPIFPFNLLNYAFGSQRYGFEISSSAPG